MHLHGSSPAERFTIPPAACQRRRIVHPMIGILIGNDRDLFRHPNPRLRESAQQSIGHVVIGTEDRLRVGSLSAYQAVREFLTGGRPEIAKNDLVRVVINAVPDK